MKVTISQDENIEWSDYTPKRRAAGSDKRHLLITTDNFLPRWDGISRFLSEIVPRLKKNYDITIIAPDYGYTHVEGVSIVRVPTVGRSFGDYNPARFSYSTIKEHVLRADIIFNQALGPIGVCAILAARQYRRPIVSYTHSVEWELFPKALAQPIFRAPFILFSKLFARFLYNRCTLLILPSENIAEQFSWQGIKVQKRVVHLGVDTKKFKPGNRRAARKLLGLPAESFIVGYHGRIAHEKNLLTLVRGFKRCTMKNKQLVIVGDGVPSLKSRLERIPEVIVTGNKNDVVPWLQAMDVYVQPSLTETTSLSVLEAMACQLPVVTSKIGFIQYYIIGEQNGIFFDNRSAFDLGQVLNRIFRDAELRNRIAVNARKTIEKSFKWSETAMHIKDVLDGI